VEDVDVVEVDVEGRLMMFWIVRVHDRFEREISAEDSHRKLEKLA
jgi:hypothetical protein